jgi:quinol monooxygenase YgiN
MYGLIGKMVVTPGQRDALVALLLEGAGDMPGCRSYVVALDAADRDAIWVTEVWDDEASHRASLAIPAVQEAIAKARPLIAGFGDPQVTDPVGGIGV